MNIKTINLTGAEVAVIVGGGNSEIRNNGTETIYASAASGIVAGADGVVSIPAGASVTVTDTRGTVYILGTGSVEVVGKDFVAPVFKTAATSGGGTTEDEVARKAISAHAGNAEIHVTTEEKAAWNTVNYSNPNLLVNPDFAINQRGVTGTVAVGEYAADMWKLESGTAEVLADGSIQLNGTLSQKLEYIPEGSLQCSASAGTAAFSEGKFTITANGERISWAKLETGSEITPFCPPDPTLELLKCQRYFVRLKNNHTSAYAYNGTGYIMNATTAIITLSLPVVMRIPKPNVTASGENIPCIITPSTPVKTPIEAKYSDRSSMLANSISLVFAISNGVVGEPAAFLLKPGSDYIDISAEL